MGKYRQLYECRLRLGANGLGSSKDGLPYCRRQLVISVKTQVIFKFARWYGGVIVGAEEGTEVEKINNTLFKELRPESHSIPGQDCHGLAPEQAD